MPPQSRQPVNRWIFWLRSGRNLESCLSAASARSNGFDTIRLLAAVSVIISHSFSLTLGVGGFEPVRWITGGQTSLGEVAVGVFFALSGMFIAASFDRDPDLLRFASKRFRRIIPGLFVAVTIIAVIMGTLTTTLSLPEYLSSTGTWGHFKNVLMLPSSYTLPGVFTDHTTDVVNGSLWTLKFEVACYIACAVVMYFRRFSNIATIFLWSLSVIISIDNQNILKEGGLLHYVIVFFDLFRYFGFGMMAYIFRDKFILNEISCVISLLICSFGMLLPNATLFLAIFGSYSVISFGFLAPVWFKKVTAGGDISYGVYVYGWPIQQLMWPIGKDSSLHWLINSALSVPLAAAIGAASWRFVERPALFLGGGAQIRSADWGMKFKDSMMTHSGKYLISHAMAYFAGGASLEERLTSQSARLNAFDSLRLCAALTVIWSHSFLLTSGNYSAEPLFWASSGQTTFGSLSVGVFFVISGTFIAASFDRSSSVWDFAKNRALRIMPALVTVVTLLALVVGPLVSKENPADYFKNVETWRYFRNTVFMPMAVHLPGVFEDHTLSTVNESIWTLKFEVACYIIAALIMRLRRISRPIAIFSWISSFLIVRYWPNANSVSGGEYYIVAISRMFRFFGAGMLMYIYRDRIYVNTRLAALSVLLTIPFLWTTWFVEAAAFIGSYSVIAFGYLAPNGFRRLASHGDVSYGVYIYGWPLQQLLWPIGVGAAAHWLINTALAVPAALALGAASWLFVEKPFLALKRKKPTTTP